MRSADFKNRHEKIFRRYENEEYYIKYKDGQPTIQKRLKLGSRVLTVVYYYKKYDNNKVQIMYAASQFKKTNKNESFCKRHHLATARSRIQKYPNFIEYSPSKSTINDQLYFIKEHINSHLRHMLNLNAPCTEKTLDQLKLCYDLVTNNLKGDYSQYYMRLSQRKDRENFIRSAILIKGVKNSNYLSTDSKCQSMCAGSLKVCA